MNFDISKVKILHLEPTSRCNAACPQCARYQADGITLNPNIEIRDLTLNKLIEKLGDDFIAQLDKMFMCGVYGDPAASNQALAIYDWFRHINPNITLGMNTNGSLRSPHWW
jgi:MoaA/NifB/PqqE/SkfB family radical SAM enzyme